MFEWLIEAPAGSYNGMLYAVKTVSAIITSPEFNMLLTVVVVIAVVICLIYTAIISTYTQKLTFTWAVNLFMGCIFMIAVIKPTGTITIEDIDDKSPTFGYFQTLDEVPLAVGLPIWVLSASENAVKKMVDKYAAPIINTLDYNTIGGELSYNLLLNMQGLTESVQKTVPLLYQDVYDYMKFCVNVGLSQGWLDYKDVQQPKDSSLWAKLKIEKGILLVGKPEDKDDCAKLYNHLTRAFLDSSSVIKKDFCAANGYGDNFTCDTVMRGILKTHFNKLSGNNFEEFIAGYIAAGAGRNVVQSYMVQAEKQIDVSNAMAAFQADKWLPKLRSTTTVAVILLAPLCFLLIFFAPGGVIKWYGGMFVWLILWSGIDQLMYMKYQNDIYEAYTAMRNSGLGIKDMLNIHYPLLEPLGMYGKMRWISMTLALAMCMGILKIGNHAMVSIADGIGQAMQQAASQTGAALSQVGGTDAAQDQFIREKARGFAAGMTAPRAIANTAELDYHRGIANANALINSVGGGSALLAANRLANTDAYNAESGVNKVEIQRELGLNAAESGSAEGLRAVGDYKALRSTLDALGDINSYLNYRARQEGWNVEQAQAHMNKMSEFVGSDKDAAIFAAETSAMSSYLQGRGYQALGGAAGDFGAYVDNKTALDVNAYWQSIGIMASDKTQAAALGLSMDEFAEFRNNRFALNDVMAAKLNERYKTDEFTAGQTISFAVNSDGGISNMTAQKTNFSGSVNGYDVQGATAAWTFGDNGGLLSETYSGLITYTDKDGNIRQGSGVMNLGDNDELRYINIKSGNEFITIDKNGVIYDHSTSIDDSFNVVTADGLQIGNATYIAAMQGKLNEKYAPLLQNDVAKHLMVQGIANQFANYYQKRYQETDDKSGNWGMNLQKFGASIGLSAGTKYDTVTIQNQVSMRLLEVVNKSNGDVGQLNAYCGAIWGDLEGRAGNTPDALPPEPSINNPQGGSIVTDGYTADFITPSGEKKPLGND